MVRQTLVFDLQPVADVFLQPIPYIGTCVGESLSSLQRKISLHLLQEHQVEATPVVHKLFRLADNLSPAFFEKKYNTLQKNRKPKRLIDFFQDKILKGHIQKEAHLFLEEFLSLLFKNRHILLCFEAEGKAVASHHQIMFADDAIQAHLFFKRLASGMEYRLILKNEQEDTQLNLQKAFPLVNRRPAWIKVDHEIHQIEGINANMVKPFIDKEVAEIKEALVDTYLKKFVAKNVSGEAYVHTEGLDVLTENELKKVHLWLIEPFLDNIWRISLYFEYARKTPFHLGSKEKSKTIFESLDDDSDLKIILIERDAEQEAHFIQLLEANGLKIYDNAFVLKENEQGSLVEMLAWFREKETLLKTENAVLEVKLRDGKALFLGEMHTTERIEPRRDWFDVFIEVHFDQLRIPFARFVPYLKRDDDFFPLPNGTWFLIPKEWKSRYADLANEAELTKEEHILKLPQSKSAFLPKQASDKVEQEDEIGLNLPEIPWNAEGLKAQLRSYQNRGVHWMLSLLEANYGACLADDMGLGKTLQTISLLTHWKAKLKEESETTSQNERAGLQMTLFADQHEAEIKPLKALVVLPSTLIFNWQKELARFAPGLFVLAHTGTKRLKDSRLLGAHDVVLTTYHTFRDELEFLKKIDWRILVLDESQAIKNRDAQISKAVRDFPVPKRLAISGTPIENSLADLWTLMDFLNPELFGNYTAFKDKYQIPIEQEKDEAAKARLSKLIRPFFLRRKKEEVAPELPPLTEQVFLSEMEKEQASLYEKTKSAKRNEILQLYGEPQNQLLALQILSQLRQLACHPTLVENGAGLKSGKFKHVLEEVEKVMENGQKVLVFSSFTRHLELFKAEFEKRNWSFAWLTGATAQADRAKEVQKFQTKPEVQIFLMTLKAGGAGLNLTAADYVFILDPWWNPAVESQAIARAHRIGQERPVHAIRFIAKNTLEEKIMEMQLEKRELGLLIDALDGEAVPKLTLADVSKMLQ